jgi:uncharacterized protein DUF6636
MRLAPPLITALALAVLVVPAASADSITFFRTPSKNIYCAREKIGRSDMLRCDVRQLAHQAPKPKDCKFGWGASFGVNARGRAHALCVSDSVIDPHARTLAYGKTRRLGPFRCTSKTRGLRCSNRSGHGFFLNRTRYRFF